MKIALERYHGLGNDYVVYDPNKNELELTSGNVKLICDRNEGLGADGILEGPIFENLESGRKSVRDQWKWNPYFRKIFKRCGICAEKELQDLYGERTGGGYILE